MLDSFLEAIGRIGIFVICARAIVHFRPKEADAKYMKLLVSIMILIQLFLPLGTFLAGGGSDAYDALLQFKISLEQGMQEAEESAARADALLEKMTLEEVRKRVEAQAAMAEEVEEEVEKESFGGNFLGSQKEKDQGGGRKEIKVKPVDMISVGNEEKESE